MLFETVVMLIMLAQFLIVCCACKCSIEWKQKYEQLLKEYSLLRMAHFGLIDELHDDTVVNETNTQWEIKQ